MARKIVTTDSGKQVFIGNRMIAVQDRETERVQAVKRGEWQYIGHASTDREIFLLLDEIGLF